MSTAATAAGKRLPANSRAPRLIIEWTPWFASFAANVRDLFLPAPPPLYLTSKPAPFWPDVFVNKRLPAAPFLESLGAHATTVLLVWIITFAFYYRPSQVTDTAKQQTKKTTAVISR